MTRRRLVILYRKEERQKVWLAEWLRKCDMQARKRQGWREWK